MYAIQLILQHCDESVAQIFTYAHPKTFTQLKFSWNCLYLQTIKLFHHFEYFNLYLKNQIFPV